MLYTTGSIEVNLLTCEAVSWTVVSAAVPLKCCSRVMELLQPPHAVLAAAVRGLWAGESWGRAELGWESRAGVVTQGQQRSGQHLHWGFGGHCSL